MKDLPDWFYNKELCDAIRDIAKTSAATIEDAELYMTQSNDYIRDIYIIKKLANVGMGRNGILPIIKALNID